MTQDKLVKEIKLARKEAIDKSDEKLGDWVSKNIGKAKKKKGSSTFPGNIDPRIIEATNKKNLWRELINKPPSEIREGQRIDWKIFAITLIIAAIITLLIFIAFSVPSFFPTEPQISQEGGGSTTLPLIINKTKTIYQNTTIDNTKTIKKTEYLVPNSVADCIKIQEKGSSKYTLHCELI